MRHSLPFACLILGLLASLLPGPLPAQALLRDLEFGANHSAPGYYTSLEGLVLFQAGTSLHGRELWCTDGTAAGTRILDLNPGGGSGVDRSSPASLGRIALFHGDDGTKAGWFATDGTLAGTRFLHDLRVGGKPARWWGPTTVLGGVGYVSVADDISATMALYRSDGTAAGTSLIQTFPGGTVRLVAAGSELFFALGSQLWATDGTAANTRVLATLPAGYPVDLVPVGSRVLFLQYGVLPLQPVWVSDGTVAGTGIVNGLQNLYALSLAALGDDGIALTSSTTGTVQLWRVGLAPAAVALLATLRPGTGSQVYSHGTLLAGDNRVFNLAAGKWSDIWSTDGTAAGTQKSTLLGRSLLSFAAVGNSFVTAAAFDGNLGAEPWVSDGTVAGTRSLGDLASGTTPSNPYAFHLAADLPGGPMLLFTAYDPVHGIEPRILPWSKVASPLLETVRPGCSAGGSVPELTRSGGDPTLGNGAFGLELRTAHPNAVAGLLFHLDHGIRISGCATLEPALLRVPLRTDAGGQAQVALPVPVDPTLVGIRVFTQGFVGRIGGAVLGVVDTTPIHALVVGL